jgi:hypothetical protein
MRRAALAFFFLTACTAQILPEDGDTPDPPDAAIDGEVSSSPRVYVHLRATHDEVPHAPATSGQTPRAWTSGIRSLHLLRTMDDAEPWLVFSHGDGFVEASYADGADTIVGSVPRSELPLTTFTWARAVHTHVRFTIDATLHSVVGPAPGALDDLIVLSDRTTLDGASRSRGWYRYVFRSGGMEYPAEGSGFELAPIAGGGFFTRIEEGETAYYFPAFLEVAPGGSEDVHLIFEVNVHEGFRWTEQIAPGFADDVFDTTTVSTEPIVQAGANSYSYFTE